MSSTDIDSVNDKSSNYTCEVCSKKSDLIFNFDFIF